ncbi:MAG: ribosome maturation factor RimP [Lachnospiraceae bacterium]|nr:ribosome maturation factor RimP [Lachnospiraceae bacterium]
MANRKNIEEKAETLLQPITDGMGISIYDVEYVKEGSDWYLRAYIDKDGGVNIQDCEAVSRAYSDVLDEADPIPDAYILEVSSPGLGRKLSKDRHFANSLGQEVELKLFEPLDGKKEFEGVLKSYDRDSLVLETEGREEIFERAKLAVVRLKTDF